MKKKQKTTGRCGKDEDAITQIGAVVLPLEVWSRILDLSSTMDVYHLSKTCMQMNKTICAEWEGWECDDCEEPIEFKDNVVVDRHHFGKTTTTRQPPNLGGCAGCQGRRTCDNCTIVCTTCETAPCLDENHDLSDLHCANNGSLCPYDEQETWRCSQCRLEYECKACGESYCNICCETLSFCEACEQNECSECHQYCNERSADFYSDVW
jgi:hypothetical protein